MALKAGTRLGQYEVIALAGAGGMGEVYRARDTRLNRDVALKVLPEAFGHDADRSARFEREAQLLAALNHSNIASIYGVEDADGRLALVMELVEGPTLADMLHTPLSEDDAIAIAAGICDALEYAHERGIIHRDLKPSNIKVNADRGVKILDFGLAKALDDGPSATHISQSPTLSVAATRAGVMIGTAAYMSPEQARGQSADRRSDIWAFGCILFEVLTRKQAFEGPTISDTIAAVLRAEAPWSRLPPGTHPAISRLLRRCLQKDPRKRLQHIGDARLELLDAREPAADIHVKDAPKVRRPWLVAAAIVIAAASGLTGWLLAPSPALAPISRFSFPMPEGALTTTSVGFEVALSPDGRTLLISGPGLGIRKRRLDAVSFEALRGAEDGAGPFFSPDGAWVGFLSDGKLKKVPIEGGLPTTIGDVPFQARGTWGEDGSIVVGGGGGLFRIPDSGGSLDLILKAPEGGFITQPRFLPGLQAVLVRIAADGPTGGASGRIEVVELASAQRHLLVTGSAPQLGPTGDLLFQQEGSLWAVRFNQRRFGVDGGAVRVLESVLSQSGVVAFATARDGSLAFIAGGAVPGRSMVWLDRAGRSTPALDVRGEFQSPRLSPDGKSVVVSVADGTSLDLWRYEFDRGTRLRLTTDGRSRRTTWSPDGKQVAFYTAELAGGGSDLYAISSTGGEPTRLLERPGLQYPDSWSPDGRFLIFENGEGPGARISARRDLWLLPIGEEPRPFLVTRFNERGAVFAPNGRLVGYVSDESGRSEIYVQPFPGPGPKVPISTNGGMQPVWSRDGHELFYREGDSLMAAAVQPDPFRAGSPQKLFDLPAALYNMDLNFADYDVAPDGRFVAVRGESAGGQSVQVILNWGETLRQALGR